ncbi:MAG: dynamin family protein [Sporichthyaceae bacterium]
MAPQNIVAAAREVLVAAARAYAQEPVAGARLAAHLERLDAPLRIAIAGKVKAGKSTLLNALVGEAIAPTDAGECTKIVTWYANATAPRISLRSKDGTSRDLPIRRKDGRLQLDLGHTKPADVDRLWIDWPTSDLATMTLIDTPGIASVSAEVSARTEAFLAPYSSTRPGHGQGSGPGDTAGFEVGGADAIVYLMRHVHADDVAFLEAFHAQAEIGSSPVNTVAVLSRADEIGSGRVDALSSARVIARRLRSDSKVRSLCQTVVPVAGLLAETGRTLRQAEFAALAQLAGAQRDYVDAMLLSADRFGRELPDGDPMILELPSAQVRSALLTRLGMFGLRTALPLIRQGCSDAPSLAAELVRRSGLVDLRSALSALFTERGDLFKARSALLAVEGILREHPIAEGESLHAAIERILAGAHEFVELALLANLRSGAIPVSEDVRAEAERLLGGSGQKHSIRLGLPITATAAEIREGATEAMTRWRRRAENPASTRAAADAARVIVRSCEGVIAALS